MSDKTTIGRSHWPDSGRYGDVNLHAPSRVMIETPYRDICGKCGARRIDQQIGLESSPDAYVAQLVAVFREIRRVLKDDGIIFVNLGDSYGPRKQLLGVPWRMAFALQADGWTLRSDIIFAKPNPMPESVTDRPTKAHEYVFLLSKAERYYFDADAVLEPHGNPAWTAKALEGRWKRSAVNKNAPERNDAETVAAGVPYATRINPAGRNIRSVWSIATQPYAGAHFATMPEKLAERCILAGSRPGDLVLDPFGGSGTTVRVARRFNRRGVMLDLNPAYLELARERISGIQPSVLEVSA